MRIEAHNRYNNPAHIILDRSRNHPNKLFMSTPIIIEPSKNKPQMLHVRGSRTYDLTKDQAIALVDTLTQVVDEKWGIDWD